MNAQDTQTGTLAGLSNQLADIVAQAASGVVRVDDGSRLTATGVLWSADGLIATTSHGVERDNDLNVELANGTRLPATLVGRDGETDVAVLKVAATGLNALPLADGNAVRIGQLAIALGRPGDSGLQATIGIVGAKYETQTGGQPGYILHTDATFYPGFSGGPLLDATGKVIGLNNLMYGRGRGVALGTSVVQKVAETLLAHGQMTRGYLGIRTQTVGLPANLRESQSITQEYGLLIVSVEAGSAAEKAGLLLGDTVLSVNGETVQDGNELRQRLRASGAGQNVTLKLLRGGQTQEITATLSAQA